MNLNDVYPNAFNGEGIFSYMYNPPWNGDYTTQELDIMFFSDYGNRIVSPLVDHYIVNNQLSIDDMKEISKIILSKYNINWLKKYEVLKSEYNPIENYKMTESENINGINQTDVSNDVTATESGTKNDNGESTVIGTSKTEIYGYNSDVASPSDAGSGSNTSNIENKSDFTNEKTESYRINENITRKDDRTLTRSGNIGVTTSQQMIESEIKLWRWNYIKDIFEDVSSMVSIPYYN